MWHRNPETYKRFDGEDNIRVGNGELISVITDRGQGWVLLCGTVIYNKEDALIYANKLNNLIAFNRIRVATERNKHK